jgi:hypothetical protein
VSAVVVRRFIDRWTDATTYVPLAARYARRFVPDRVRRDLFEALLHQKVLERDRVYYFGPVAHAHGSRGKCWCYRVGPAYRGVPVRATEVVHPELLRKMDAADMAERAAITDPVHRALRHWHDRVVVLPDAPYGEHPLLDRLIGGERRFTVCAQGRIHTNVANLPRQHRQFIQVGGAGLDSIDVATSQPLLLGLLLTGRAGTGEGGRGRKGGAGGGTQALCVHSSNPDLTEYLADCLSGRVYDRLAAETGYARDDVKPLFLAVIYGHPEHMHTRVGEAVRKLYPTVFAAVADLNFELGHGGLPRLMQTVESRVMIRRVAARLLREAPRVPILTVHDCILFPPGHAARVERAIREEWAAEFGVAPRTKLSLFTAPQEPRVHTRPRTRAGAAHTRRTTP